MARYGACPACGESKSHPKTSRERRPDGYTRCGWCGVDNLSRDWEAPGWSERALRAENQLAAARRLLAPMLEASKGATPGEWEAQGSVSTWAVTAGSRCVLVGKTWLRENGDSDAHHIAATCPAKIQALADELGMGES